MLIQAGVGLLGGIFGGGDSGPDYPEMQFRMWQKAMQRAFELYDSTNLEQLDTQAVSTLNDQAMQQAMKMLGNYDARAASMGSPLGKSDTKKDRSRTQIAADVATPAAQLAAQLLTTRPQRKAALLPNPAQAAAGAGQAQYLDQRNEARAAGEMGGLMDAAKAIGKLYTDWKWSGNKTGTNDVYAGTPDDNYSWIKR